MQNYHEKLSKIFGHDIDFFELDGQFHHFSAGNPKKKPLWAIGTEWIYNNKSYYCIQYGNFQNPFINGQLKSWENEEGKTKYFVNKFKKQQKILHAKIKKEKNQKHEDAKVKASLEVKNLDRAKKHEYLEKKQINPYNTKIKKDDYGNDVLAIPAYKRKGIVGMQYISESGSKWFSSGIDIQGAFFPFKRIADSEIVYLCEGFATGATIQKYTDNPVVACFTANNLPKAIKEITKINKDCWVVICADNDKVNEQTRLRTGIYYARLAANNYAKTKIITPNDDTEWIGDFNDLMFEVDDSAMKERIDIPFSEITKEYENNIKENGFSEIDQKGKVTRNYSDLLEYFKFKHPYKVIGNLKQIWIYNGKYYERVEDQYIKNFAQENFEPFCDKDSERTEFLNLVKASDYSSTDFLVRRDDSWINFKNCLYNYKTDQAIPHTHKIFKTWMIPHNYDPKAKCPTWDLLCKNLLKDRKHLIDQLEETIGWTISGAGFDIDQKFTIFGGGGRNGKTTMLNIIKHIVGEQATSSVSITDISKNRFAASALEGKLLNISEEEPKKCFEETGTLKKLVGNSAIQFEIKNKPSYSSVNRAKILISYNTMPYLNDVSDGMKRRFMIIPFEVNLIKHKEKMIDNVYEKISMEYPGIINNLIKAFKRLEKRGSFIDTLESEQALSAIIKESSPISQWIDEFIEITDNPSNVESINSLHQSFVDFSGSRMSKAMFSKLFLDNTERFGVKRVRKSTLRGFSNIILT